MGKGRRTRGKRGLEKWKEGAVESVRDEDWRWEKG